MNLATRYTNFWYSFAKARKKDDPHLDISSSKHILVEFLPIDFAAYKMCLVRAVTLKEKILYIVLLIILPLVIGIPLFLIPLDAPKQGSIRDNLAYSIGFIGYAATLAPGVFVAWTWPFVGPLVNSKISDGLLTPQQMNIFKLTRSGDIPASFKFHSIIIPFVLAMVFIFIFLPLNSVYPLPFQIMVAGGAYAVMLPAAFIFIFPRVVSRDVRFRQALYKIFMFTFATAGLWFVCIGYTVAFGYTTNSLGQAILAVVLHVLLSLWEKMIQFLNNTTPARFHGLATWWIEFVGNMFFLLVFPDVKDVTTFVLLQVLKIFLNLSPLITLSHTYWNYRMWIVSKVFPIFRLSIFFYNPKPDDKLPNLFGGEKNTITVNLADVYSLESGSNTPKLFNEPSSHSSPSSSSSSLSPPPSPSPRILLLPNASVSPMQDSPSQAFAPKPDTPKSVLNTPKSPDRSSKIIVYNGVSFSDNDVPSIVEFQPQNTPNDAPSALSLQIDPYWRYKILQARLYVYSMLTDILAGILFITSWLFFRYGWNSEFYQAKFMCEHDFFLSWLYATIQLAIVIVSFILGVVLIKVFYKIDVLQVTIPQIRKHLPMLVLSSLNVFPFIVILVLKHDRVLSFIFPDKYEYGKCN